MDAAKINGMHIAYRHRKGLGRTVVFANSLGSDQSIWDEVIAALPGGYGVLTYDLPGHGLSSGTATGIEGMADDLGQLIDHLGLADVLFCGVSIGGMIGQVLAARRPDVVKAAVLCNTGAEIGPPERWEVRIEAVQTRGLAGIAGEIVSGWFGPDYAARDTRLALHEAMVSRTNEAGYMAAAGAIRDADLRDLATTIAAPVLCIAGSHDQSVPVAVVEDLAGRIPGAQLQVLDGVGHLPSLEAPRDLARAIADFDPGHSDLDIAGKAMRRAVLGEAHVDRAVANACVLDQPFQSLITTGAWGHVWASPAISARERSMLTLAMLAATGNFYEIPMHVRATRRTGASAQDIAEALQHVAIYAGVPRANHALKLAKEVMADMGDMGDDP